MKLIDTHCHLDLPQYEEDIEEVVKRASLSGVERVIVPGISVESSRKAVELAAKYPSVFAAVGIHPHEADKVRQEDIDEVRKMAEDSEKVVAIGEIGLDYYKGYSNPENQKRLFKAFVKMALELDFPVIVHNRDAAEDVLEVLRNGDFNILRGVIHCFSGDETFLKKVLAMDFFISFAGNITFQKASDLREMLNNVPVDKLLLETDGPYITPEPLRGKRNEPANVKYLLDVYSENYGKSKEDLADITTRNADKLFRLGIEKENTIVYKIRESLYLNITYRCTNRCTFCTRDVSDYVKGHDLKLDKEPTCEEMVTAIGDPTRYDEIVFCGFGEPTLRLEMIKKVAKYVKDNGGKVRLTTNGEADLIHNRIVVPELKGLIDRVSVSLNAADEDTYDHICRSIYGEKAYEAALAFITECRQEDIEVEITCLDIVGEEGIKSCEKIAKEKGASFRLRHFNVVG